jgi:hypothetical protein
MSASYAMHRATQLRKVHAPSSRIRAFWAFVALALMDVGAWNLQGWPLLLIATGSWFMLAACTDQLVAAINGGDE